MNVCLHQGEKAEPKPWKCSHCGSVLEMITSNGCTIHYEVKLSDKMVLVKCPACGEYEPWHYDVRT